jgi:hypothetical protein
MKPIAAAFILFMATGLHAASAAPAKAKLFGTKAPYATPYAGLIPDGFQLQQAPAIDAATLARSKVVLIPSGNYDEYSRLWADYFEKGGFEKTTASRWMGVDRGRIASIETSSDPRAFATRIADALRPHVRELAVAEDLPGARAQGADYFLVVDDWTGVTNWWGNRMRATGGVYLLDGQLRRVFAAEGSGDGERHGILTGDPNQIYGQMVTTATNAMGDAVVARLARFLQSLPAGSPAQAAAPAAGPAPAVPAPGS